MDFSLTDEQRMLQDTVERLVADQYGFEQRRQYMEKPEGFDSTIWGQMADLGLLGVPFSEDVGGFGGGAVETMLVMEAFGKGLVLEPYVASVLTAGALIADAGDETQKTEMLEALISGELRLAFAHTEPGNRYEETRVSTRAEKRNDRYVLTGAKIAVLHGDSAHRLIVTARTAGNEDDAEGLSLFLVDAGAAGLDISGYPTNDGLRAANLELNGVPVPADALIGKEGQAAELIRLTLDRGAFAVCAEAVGAMSRACDITLEYIKQRKQFGVPIGTFQSIQHRMVEMRIALEQARSSTMKAAARLQDGTAEERRKAVSAAKVQVGEGGRFVAEWGIQLHGGIGMTAEYHLPHYAKRLVMIDHQFGDVEHHLSRFSAMMDVPQMA